MRVYVGSDHAGFELKAKILGHLNDQGTEAIDVGAPTYDREDDYPAWCIETARQVADDDGARGIVIGGSGNGEQIAANKVPGIRAALAWSEETARLARQHNDAQVVGIGARMHTFDDVLAIVDTFLTTDFTGEERHVRRIEQLAEFERTGAIDLPE